jgi:DNA-binding transcriptional LysR family regulator
VLLGQARELLDQGRRFTESARKLGAGEIGRLTIGFVSTAMYGYLPDVVRAFGERYPEVDLQLREATSDVQLRKLETEEIDIGFLLGELPAGVGGVRTRLVRVDRLIVAVPASWPPARYGSEGLAQLERLRDEPLLTIPRQVGPALYDAILSCFMTRGMSPRFGQEGIQMQTLLGLTAAGLGYAMVPASMRMLARPDIRFVEIADGTPEVELRVAWRTSDPNLICRNFLQLATSPQERNSST